MPCTSSVRHRRTSRLDRPAPPPALRAPPLVRLVRLDHHDQDLLIRPVPPRPPLDIRPGHHRVLGIEHLIPHRPRRHPVPRPSRNVTRQPGTLPGPGTPALDRHAAHATKTLKPESRGEPDQEHAPPLHPACPSPQLYRQERNRVDRPPTGQPGRALGSRRLAEDHLADAGDDVAVRQAGGWVMWSRLHGGEVGDDDGVVATGRFGVVVEVVDVLDGPVPGDPDGVVAHPASR